MSRMREPRYAPTAPPATTSAPVLLRPLGLTPMHTAAEAMTSSTSLENVYHKSADALAHNDTVSNAIATWPSLPMNSNNKNAALVAGGVAAATVAGGAAATLARKTPYVYKQPTTIEGGKTRVVFLCHYKKTKKKKGKTTVELYLNTYGDRRNATYTIPIQKRGGVFGPNHVNLITDPFAMHTEHGSNFEDPRIPNPDDVMFTLVTLTLPSVTHPSLNTIYEQLQDTESYNAVNRPPEMGEQSVEIIKRVIEFYFNERYGTPEE